MNLLRKLRYFRMPDVLIKFFYCDVFLVFYLSVLQKQNIVTIHRFSGKLTFRNFDHFKKQSSIHKTSLYLVTKKLPYTESQYLILNFSDRKLLCGTPFFASPELVKTEKSDIYSLGRTLLYLVVGRENFISRTRYKSLIII